MASDVASLVTEGTPMRDVPLGLSAAMNETAALLPATPSLSTSNATSGSLANAAATASGNAKISVKTVPALHSLSSASQKIYLDFNGQTVFGTPWNERNQGRAIVAPAFDLDADPATFSAAELNVIESVWSRVAEDFAPFDIDVTTEEPQATAFKAGAQAIRVLFSTNIDQATGHQWYPNLGGVAFTNSWRWESDTPVWIFANQLQSDEKRMAESASHEVGHSLGLNHDGVVAMGQTPESEYYAGHGTGPTSWAPIMGLGFDREVTQWSSGEYRGASTREDDLSTIASTANRITYRDDDHGDTVQTATPWWLFGSDDDPQQNQGVISTILDVDAFRLLTVGGEIHIHVSPAAIGPNLDVFVQLQDSTGRTLATSNPSDSLGATISLDLPAGQYLLLLRGTGFGDPASNGYSAYGSLGQYTVSISHRPPTSPEPQPAVASITGRYVFYNNSAYDDGSALLSRRDALAIAFDKQALLPGQKASFVNYTSYTRGLNGLAIDIKHVPDISSLSIQDFRFAVGNSSDPDAWVTAPPPHAMLTIPDGGGLGVVRVLFAWPDDAIKNQWLRVTVVANARTGLPRSDMFYFGNAAAETGDQPGKALVDGVDYMNVWLQQGTVAFTTSNPYDVNRDGQVDLWDLIAVRSNDSKLRTPLQVISPTQTATSGVGDAVRALAISYVAEQEDENSERSIFAAFVRLAALFLRTDLGR